MMPKDKTIISIAIIFVVIIAGTLFYLTRDNAPEVSVTNAVINENYWFEAQEDGSELLFTSDGWTFELNARQEYTLTGVILGTKIYGIDYQPYRPINYFSPMDILVGVDGVSDNFENYDYEITSWADRVVTWYVYNDYQYFLTHTGNNHLIPHTVDAYNRIMELETGDRFSLSGYIVEPYGTRGSDWYEWPSDNRIGNWDCEVILVDEITILP